MKKVIAILLLVSMICSMAVISVNADEVNVVSAVTSSENVVEETPSTPENVDVSSDGNDVMIPYEPKTDDTSSEAQDVVDKDEAAENTSSGNKEDGDNSSSTDVMLMMPLTIKVTGVANATQVTLAIEGQTNTTVIVDAQNDWTKSLDMAVGQYTIKVVRGNDSKYTYSSESKEFVVNNTKGQTVTLEIDEAKKPSKFLEFLKNNSFLLLGLLACYVVLFVRAAKKRRQR